MSEMTARIMRHDSCWSGSRDLRPSSHRGVSAAIAKGGITHAFIQVPVYRWIGRRWAGVLPGPGSWKASSERAACEGRRELPPPARHPCAKQRKRPPGLVTHRRPARGDRCYDGRAGSSSPEGEAPLRYLAVAQGLYFAVTGFWPVLEIRT